MGHGEKNQNRGDAIVENRRRLVELEKALPKIRRDLSAEIKAQKITADLVGTESKLRVGLEGSVRKLKLVFVSIDGRLRMLERPWWAKLLRRPATKGALFKLVPIEKAEDAPLDGEEIVPEADDIAEPERGHHVLDIQGGVIGVSDTNPPEEEPS